MPADLRYPRYDLRSSLEVANVLRDRAGGEASNSELATFLGYKSTNNGAFLSRVAAAKMFGFVEGPASRLRTAARALQILEPDYPEVEMKARLDAFESVPLFKAFLTEYEGQPLPKGQGMRNALVNKFNVAPSKASLALARLLDSAEQAGLFRAAGARTKMVRPTIAPPATESLGDDQVISARSSEPHVPDTHYPKLIEGALETVPWQGDMSADEIDTWCEFFKAAMKIHFRVARK